MDLKSKSHDRLILRLRAYVDTGPEKRARSYPQWSSGITVTFDTETFTNEGQALRFGAYQVRHDGALLERGVFHADDLTPADLTTLRETFAEERPSSEGEVLALRSRAEFVEAVFFKWGLEAGGMIVGFNLPFDISRLATSHSYSKRRGSKETGPKASGALTGGFSFVLAEKRPRVRVKHRSQRAAFFSYAGKSGYDHNPDRGYFTDVKTLAATMTGQSHSLASLAKLLGTTPKSTVDTFDGPLTHDLIRYGMQDVQVTWECFAELKSRYDRYELSTVVHALQSEASLGKALLAQMNIRPWRQSQPDFSPEIIGQIMSAYYGGRAEVKVRRVVTPVIHCDFLSMYPTVCTLLGLWRFIIAQGVTTHDATEEVRQFVDACTLADLRDPATWGSMPCMVQVEPDDDIFPVRAAYGRERVATIGVNRLTATEPMWFALPDVLAAKFLGGKTPKIVSAIRFEAGPVQEGLKPITLAGRSLDPATDDFFKVLIDHRRTVQARQKAATGEEAAALNAEQLGLKILANSTSYGIFVELNVETLASAKPATLYDFRGVGRRVKAKKVEKPGRYFHPLLGAVITSAARLMLALTERNALDQGLGWAFCDTDSLAIANPQAFSKPEFIERVEAVLGYFEPLNPYDKKGSILQLEKVNFPPGKDGDRACLRPVNCLAISAKRYVLFDRDVYGRPVIRKGSAHGLGHLLAPYTEPPAERARRLREVNLELWEEDLWLAIIAADDAGKPDLVDFASLKNFDEPAVSRYAATNQTLLKWFDGYNDGRERADQVWPFNFLLTYQAKSALEMASVDPAALELPVWRRRVPQPVSRYSSDPITDRPDVFDRSTRDPIDRTWLKTYHRSLVRHHLHPETKFWGGTDTQRGALERRHVQALAFLAIGKEADNLDERMVLGEDDEAIDWELGSVDFRAILAEITDVQAQFGISDRSLCDTAKVSPHTLRAMKTGTRLFPEAALELAYAADRLRVQKHAQTEQFRHALSRLGVRVAKRGDHARIAKLLRVSSSYLSRMLTGQKQMSSKILSRVRDLD